MLIESLTTTLVEVPLPKPIGTAIHQMRSVGCVLTEIRTTDGVSGQGLAFTLNADRLRAFDEMILGMAPLVVGEDARNVERIGQSIWSAINPTGHKGVTISALSAIDTALWDCIGKAANMPLAKLFGGMRDRVDTYASSGLWLSHSVEELTAEAQRFVDQGFWGMKIRIGSDYADDDIRRIQAIRDTVGDDIDLYVDANQAFTPKQAIRIGRQLEQFNLVWFEEPVSALDLVGHGEVRTALDTPIASGETEYTRFGMQAMLDARAADILMPDLQRIGGLSEFRKAAAAAAAQHTNVSSHFFTEYSLSIAGSTANCVSVEHIDWFSPLFNEQVVLEGGQLVIPDRPGTGFTFDEQSIAAHRI
jgi:L-alanine-DL-glutamate epimerase-like enolase superfamily enzyme